MIELTISLDSSRKKPLYEQIYQYIREEIETGRIRAGERLPSSRMLSQNLGVSRSTVDQAYEQLLAEGYMISLARKGYFACEVDRLYEIPTDPPRTVFCEGKEQQTKWKCDFALNGIDREGFPYLTWQKISRQVLAEDDGTLFQLGDAQGERELRRELANYLHHARGVNCQPDQIVLGAGNDYLLLLLHVILGGGLKIAMDDPTYLSAYHDFQSMGYEVYTLAPDEKGMCPAQLESSGADLAYVMPSHQFPLGTVMPISRRQQLLAWAGRKEGRYLIEDDYDSEFRYKGKPIPALQGYDSREKVIYLGTFSKSLAPAIRISYMVLPLPLLAKYRERAANFSVTVSRTDQKILERFLKEGYFERHLNRMKGVYREKHDVLLEQLRMLGKKYRVRGEHAGVHLLLELREGLGEAEAVKKAAEAGIKVYGLSEYCIRKREDAVRATVLLGYATLSKEQIREGVKTLAKVWQ